MTDGHLLPDPEHWRDATSSVSGGGVFPCGCYFLTTVRPGGVLVFVSCLDPDCPTAAKAVADIAASGRPTSHVPRYREDSGPMGEGAANVVAGVLGACATCDEPIATVGCEPPIWVHVLSQSIYCGGSFLGTSCVAVPRG